MCIFCKIINKEIPAQIIYDDEHCIGMLDINPVNEGHTLVIPKKHYDTLTDCDEDTLKHLIVIVKNLAQKIKDKLNYDAFKVVINNGEKADQVVPHLHIHIIPKHNKSDQGWATLNVSQADLEKTKQKLL